MPTVRLAWLLKPKLPCWRAHAAFPPRQNCVWLAALLIALACAGALALLALKPLLTGELPAFGTGNPRGWRWGC